MSTPATVDGLPTLTIGPSGGTNALGFYIGTVDPVNDLIPIYDASTTSTVNVYRNQFLNLSSQPVGLTDSQTLTNKTLTSPTLTTPIFSGTILGTYTLAGTPTFPSSVVTTTGSQSLTNKTIIGGTASAMTIINPVLTVDNINGYTTSTNVTVGNVTLNNGAVGASTVTSSGLITASNGLTVSSGTLTLPNNSITTSMVNAGAITAANMVNGMVSQRQGSTTGLASWYTSGTNNTATNTYNAFVQVGSVLTNGSSATAVTFPTAYTYAPIVMVSYVGINATGYASLTASGTTTTGFSVDGLSAGSRVAANNTIMWMAVGQ